MDDGASAALLCLTRGEASALGEERGLSPVEVGDLREGRLREVARILDLDALVVGGLPDGRLSRTPLEEVAAPIRKALETFRPQVVIGHDPRGVNAHPDHIASHWAIRRALEAWPHTRFAMVAYLPEACEAIRPRLLLPTAGEEIDAVLMLSREETRRKEACLRVHEALVTMVPERAGKLLLRPPEERFDFLGEDLRPPVGDLF